MIKPPILSQMLLKSDLYDKSNLRYPPVKREAGTELLDVLDIEYPGWDAEW